MSDALAWAIFAAGAVVLALFFVFLILRERRAADRRLGAVVNELTARMDGMLRELHAAVDRTDDGDQRARILGELAGTIDLDEVLARVLEAAGAMRGVDAAM